GGLGERQDLGQVHREFLGRGTRVGGNDDARDVAAAHTLGHGTSERRDLGAQLGQRAVTRGLAMDPDACHQMSRRSASSSTIWRAASSGASRTTLVAPRAAGGRESTTFVSAPLSPTVPGSIPRSASVSVVISLERAAMIPFNDGYRGSPSACVPEMRAGIGASRTS